MVRDIRRFLSELTVIFPNVNRMLTRLPSFRAPGLSWEAHNLNIALCFHLRGSRES